MKVWACGPASHADIGDHLALMDMTADAQAPGETADMAIGRAELRGVLDADVVAVAREGSDLLDHAVACGIDRRADGRAEIHTLVHQAVAQDGMHAHAEARGDLGPIDRRA